METYYINCKAYTMDPKDHLYSVVGVKNGRICWIGDTLPPDTADADVIDMAGACILPGFSDTHMHLLNYAFLQTVLRLFGVDSIDKIQKLGRAYLEEHSLAPGQWLFGRGWNQELFQEGRMITRVDLDQISAEVPICIVRVCGHIAALNTPAMKLLIESEDVGPQLEFIDEAQGLITESAVHHCYSIMPTLEKAFIKDLIRRSQADLLAHGITAAGTDDFVSLPGRNRQVVYESYCEMDRDGELKLRIQEQCAVMKPEDMDAVLQIHQNHIPSDHLKMDVVKIVLDGSLGARTALFRQPYADDPSVCGTQAFTAEELNELVSRSHRNGMQVAVHAIGDEACSQVIDACELAQRDYPREDHRHGIVHFEVVDEKILKRAKDLGMIGYVQPVFLSSDMDMLEDRLGPDRARGACCWKSMRDMGIPVSGGSDAPVESFDILENIFCAVTRRRIRSDDPQVFHPSECLSVRDAAALFTCDAPYMSFDEKKRGTIEVGKLADLVILSDDLFSVPVEKIPDIQVLATMVDGEFVYLKEGTSVLE